MSERAEIVHNLQTIAAEWRGRSMSDAAQARFDDLTRSLDAHDEEAAALEAVARQAHVPVILAEKYTRRRIINSAVDRRVAVQDMQELAAEYRACSMPFEVQYAFDGLVAAIDGYDATAPHRAAAPPDPRDAVLHRMRARAQGATGW